MVGPVDPEPPADDWPVSAVAEFHDLCASYEKISHIPGEAARLAFEHLKRRYDAPRVATWTDSNHADVDWDSDVSRLPISQW